MVVAGTYYPIIIAAFGFLTLVLAIIIKDITYSNTITKNTVYLMGIGTMLILVSLFLSNILQIITPNIAYIFVMILAASLGVLAGFSLSVARSTKISLITLSIVILSLAFIIFTLLLGIIK